jgi:hypothetical protein
MGVAGPAAPWLRGLRGLHPDAGLEKRHQPGSPCHPPMKVLDALVAKEVQRCAPCPWAQFLGLSCVCDPKKGRIGYPLFPILD